MRKAKLYWPLNSFQLRKITNSGQAVELADVSPGRSPMVTAWLWAMLIAYGLVMWGISPLTSAVASFFGGRDRQGRRPGTLLVTTSVVASWIFSKSVTNAADLGRDFGLLGGITYAVYYAGIPICGWLIVRIRRRTGTDSLLAYLRNTYGPAAARLFGLIILIRLYNEVWSNTEVVAAYFGKPGSTEYLLSATVFALLILAYTLKGGMRTSLVTDVLQFGLLVAAVTFTLAWIVPRAPSLPLGAAKPGFWNSGIDLFFVAVLQCVAYPFHDPVLTDRAFLADETTTIRAFILAGGIAGALIFFFSFVGMAARGHGNSAVDAPVHAALSAGAGAMALMMAVMMISGGSALDSALSSASKAVALDLRQTALPQHESDARNQPVNRVEPRPLRGRLAMIAFAILGNLPVFLGASILKATTISGTVVLGLAPIFLFPSSRRLPSVVFLAPVLVSVVGGLLSTIRPQLLPWSVGTGSYGSLLAWNLCVTAASWLTFVAARVTADVRGRQSHG